LGKAGFETTRYSGSGRTRIERRSMREKAGVARFQGCSR